MRKLISLATVLTALVLGACGSDNTITPGVGAIGPDGAAPVAGVTVLASSPSLPSDTGQSLTVSVIVRDSNNVAMEGVTVIMAADSGTLQFTNPVTDQNGLVTALLTGGGDPTPRPITVSADAQGVADSVTVDVVGTDLTVNGPPALAQNDVATYTVVLTDAAGNGIANQTVEIGSASGNTLDQTMLTTDVSGQAQVQLTASAAGPDTITATALGIMAESTLNVSDDTFVLTAPAAGAEIVLNTPQPVTLNWSVGGVPQAGQTITFSATRGTLSALTAVTDAAGDATVSIQSTNAGPAVITASNAAGTSTQVEVQFIADLPASIDVQANPFTIGPNEQASITAVVRDAQNNLVTNAIVQFDLQDVTGGQLSVASATTDNQGRATTFYTSSQTTSANNGVVVTATVQGTAISGSVSLTVAQRELFISIGTGNSIFEPNSAQYRIEFAIQVTDSQGNGVEGVTVQAGILSDAYFKGFWFYDALASQWVQNVTAGPCIDEDINNRNGVLDPGEDLNGSGRIEAGNIATVVSQVSGGGTFTTDVGGFGIVDVIYPQEHARWVNVTLEATTSVQGTEFAKASNFVLPINGDDVDDENEVPPGQVSPFGQSATCLDTN
jgi:protocatechuate 3,4-dioxygenase beta subunit